ncbi:hypothetical protein [Embleya sp. NPDC050493]
MINPVEVLSVGGRCRMRGRWLPTPTAAANQRRNPAESPTAPESSA